MKNQQSYPLYFLFVLVTISAVLIGMLNAVIPSLARGQWNIGGISATVLGTGLLAATLGVLIGRHHLNRLLGVTYGGLLGMALGSVAGLLFFVDSRHFGQLVAAQIGGAVLLVCVTACLGLGRRRDP